MMSRIFVHALSVLIALLVPWGAANAEAPATFEILKANDKPDVDSTKMRLNGRVHVRVYGAPQLDQPAKAVLWINDAQLGIAPTIKPVSEGTQDLFFDLRRTDANRPLWAELLGIPPLKPETEVRIGLQVAGAVLAARGGNPDGTANATLIRYDELWAWIASLAVVAVIVIAGYLCFVKGAIRDKFPGGNPDPKDNPYSLGRFQMAVWMCLVIASFLFILTITGDFNSIRADTLVLLGISGTTALASISVDGTRDPATQPPRSEGFWKDILNDKGGPGLHRYQMFVWTVLLAVIYIWRTLTTLETPSFDNNLLALMGIGGGLYVGFKIPERQ